MDGLRWILLGAGLLLIIGVVLFGRRPGKSSAHTGTKRAPTASDLGAPDPVDDDRLAPILGEDGASPSAVELSDRAIPSIDTSGTGEQVDIEDLVDPGAEGRDFQPNPEGADAAHPAGAAAELPDVPQKIVTVRIVGHEKATFAGDKLVLSLRGIGMRHGRFGIFHRYDGNDESRVVFSAASLLEPGSFDLENLKEQRLPGISLFMVLPGPIDGTEAFDQMMAASRTVAKSLDGELLDEAGSTLSIQRERYLREEIIQYQLEARRA